MTNREKEKVINEISKAHRIVVMGHKNGDGDSFGSEIALKLGLEKLGKSVEIIAEDGLPGYLEFLYDYINFTIKDDFNPF